MFHFLFHLFHSCAAHESTHAIRIMLTFCCAPAGASSTSHCISSSNPYRILANTIILSLSLDPCSNLRSSPPLRTSQRRSIDANETSSYIHSCLSYTSDCPPHSLIPCPLHYCLLLRQSPDTAASDSIAFSSTLNLQRFQLFGTLQRTRPSQGKLY